MPTPGIRQERPPHLRPETIHPAMRERGRAIPHVGSVQTERPQSAPRIVEGRVSNNRSIHCLSTFLVMSLHFWKNEISLVKELIVRIILDYILDETNVFVNTPVIKKSKSYRFVNLVGLHYFFNVKCFCVCTNWTLNPEVTSWNLSEKATNSSLSN